jgi:hypothetical protein
MRTLTNVQTAVALMLRVVNAILAADDGFRRKLLEKYERIDDQKLKGRTRADRATEERHGRNVQADIIVSS